MATVDVRFAGSVPANYDRYMTPLFFRPYAEELARRAKAMQPHRILETACGTGVVTSALAAALPDAEIIATDLNRAMLEIPATRVENDKVSFREADALDLPFHDGCFDLVVCQFGSMFYPDRVKGHAEARRMLHDGGHYLLAIWDRIDRNPLSDLANRCLHRLFPDDPPKFMERGAFSYFEKAAIERDLRAAGFGTVVIETIEHMSRSASAAEAAHGLVYGSPMGAELQDYGPDVLDRVFDGVREAARRYEGPEGFAAPMSAHIVTATR